MQASCESGGIVGRGLTSTRESSHPFLLVFPLLFLLFSTPYLKSNPTWDLEATCQPLFPKPQLNSFPRVGLWVLSSMLYCCLVSNFFLLNVLNVKFMTVEFFWRGLWIVSVFKIFLFRKKVKSFSHVRLFATLWTIAHQAPLSMGFSGQEYWSGLPFPSPGDLPNPGMESRSPALQVDALTSEPPGKLGGFFF